MKRIILLLFAVVIAFASCETLEDNSPGFQSEVDSIFFRALDIRGTQNDDGSFTLQGIGQGQKITLNIEKGQLGSYPLGGSSVSSASYEGPDDDIYSTAPFGDGKIEITDRCLSCGWLTGSFRFVGKRSENDTLSVRVQKGFFFEVNFLNDIGGIPVFSDDTMIAEVDGASFGASAVISEVDGSTLIIQGSDGAILIKIEVPVDALAGNYSIPRTGFDASITVDGVTTQADTGLISVNFNDTTTGNIRVFFSFEAGGINVTVGNTRVDY